MEAPHNTTSDTGAAPPSPPPPPFGSPRPRQLRRRPDQGHIAGVCAGVAEYFNVDPVIVRIAAVVLLISGPGLVAYILAWVFVPEADSGSALVGQPGRGDGRDRGMQIFGIVLLVVAVSVLWGDWWDPGRRWLFPFGLMALGAWLLLRRRDDEIVPPAPPDLPGVGDRPPPPAPGGLGLAAGEALVDTTVPGDATEGTARPTDTTGPGGETGEVTAPWDAATAVSTAVDGAGGGGGEVPPPPPFPWGGPPPVSPESLAARRRRRMLGPIVMGTLLVWAGLAWIIGVSIESALAVGLCIVGLGFVLGAFVGGSWALIVPAVAIGGALIVTTLVDIPLSGPVGDRTWTPETTAEVDDLYEVSVGEGTLDLTRLRLGADDHLEIEATVGIGHLVILVPEGVTLSADADVGMGETVLLGARNSGFSVSDERRTGDPSSGPSIELDLQAGIGQVEVRQGPFGFFPTDQVPASTSSSLPR